jgi:molybdopterin converting factor subunit 1
MTANMIRRLNERAMKITVLLFAAAREAAGRESVEIDTAGPVTIRAVRERILAQIPQLTSMAASLLWAVNSEYAADHRTVGEGDVVACFPPVSGG